MLLKILGSNSQGNCYILECETSKDKLIIDCGVTFTKIKQALKFNYANTYCVMSHEHGDHAKYANDFIKAGISIHTQKATLDKIGLGSNYRAKAIEPNKPFRLGSFDVIGFPLHHIDTEKKDIPCLGYLIRHPEMGTTVFITDTHYCDYKFDNVTQLIVEANHDTEILFNNNTMPFLRTRIMESHMSLQVCKDLLLANDLSKVINIVLIHLSDSNSHARNFKSEISKITGKIVHIADSGMTIPFNINPF